VSFLLESTVRVSLILLVALSVGIVLRRGSAALRHWVLGVAIACAAMMPVLQATLPSWRLDIVALGGTPSADERAPDFASSVVVQSGPISESQAAGTPPSSSRRQLPISTVLLAVWLAGALFFWAVLAVGLLRLGRLASGASRIETGRLAVIAGELRETLNLRRGVTLLQGASSDLLITWGAARPAIMLPPDAHRWTEERARVVLQHEFAHIARGDWPVQMLAEVLRAAYWFNPLLWIACGRLRHESERACDDWVIRAGVEPVNYASHLLELARHTANRRAAPALGMARLSSLEGRVCAMLNDRTVRHPLNRAARVATLVAFAAVSAPIATAQTRAWTFGGTVVDQTNRLVANARLVLTNQSTAVKHETRTDQTGRFEIPDLASGEYQLEVQQPGFKSFVESVTVAQKDVSRNIHLQIGSVQETLTVKAEPAASGRAEPAAPASVDQRRQRARDMRDQKCGSGAAPTGNLGGEILPPLKLTNVRPEYPEALKGSGVEGDVTLDAVIGLDGTVRDVKTISSPHAELERAAVEAVQRWEFSATYLNCTPVEVPMRVTIKFVVP
jgi:TonB family protein